MMNMFLKPLRDARFLGPSVTGADSEMRAGLCIVITWRPFSLAARIGKLSAFHEPAREPVRPQRRVGRRMIHPGASLEKIKGRGGAIGAPSLQGWS